MKKKNLFLTALTIVALGIWSHNIYRIFLGVTQSDIDNADTPIEWNSNTQAIMGAIQTTAEDFVYDASGRDPFQNWLVQEKPKIVQKKPVTEPKRPTTKNLLPPLPELRFSGVVRDNRGILAIIEDPQGRIFFVSEGDSVNHIAIKGVFADSVCCSFRQQEFKLILR